MLPDNKGFTQNINSCFSCTKHRPKVKLHSSLLLLPLFCTSSHPKMTFRGLLNFLFFFYIVVLLLYFFFEQRSINILKKYISVLM